MIKQIPRSVEAIFLPGLKVDDLVSTKKQDRSEKDFVSKPIPAGAVGRVKEIHDMGGAGGGNDARFLIYVKFVGHPLTNFYTEEVNRVKVPAVRGDRRKDGRPDADRRKGGITRTPGKFKDAVDAFYVTERKLKGKR